jgi:hypothetical protein
VYFLITTRLPIPITDAILAGSAVPHAEGAGMSTCDRWGPSCSPKKHTHLDPGTVKDRDGHLDFFGIQS